MPALSPAGLANLSQLLGGLDLLARLLQLPEREAGGEAVPVGRFCLTHRIGVGRFGIVFRADDPELRRAAAVKVPQPSVLTDPHLRERFIREARALGRLDHPGVVPLFEAGQDGGLAYLASAYVDGLTLAEWLGHRSVPAPPSDTARLVSLVARAVQHAHDRGVLHCDLKPANVLLDPLGGVAGIGNPRVTDFGLARLLEDDPTLTQSFQVAGTPLYMAPEQARGDRRGLTVASDVYALGAILYELLTGRPPFTGASDCEVRLRVVSEAPVPPRRANPKVPRDLEAVCLRCLEKGPNARYRGCGDLADDLDRFLAGRPVSVRPAGPMSVAGRWAARNPIAAWALTLAAATAAVATAAVATANLRESRQAAMLRAEVADRRAAEDRAEAGEFVSEVERVRQRRSDRLPGWAATNVATIRRLASAAIARDHLASLRTEAAAALSAEDLGVPRAVAPGFAAYCPAYHPDGKTLALAGWVTDDDGLCTVKLVDPSTGEEVRTLTCPADRDWVRRDRTGVPDGLRSLAYSGDGRRLAAGTRSGWVVLWDLDRADRPPARWRHAAPRQNPRDERVDRVAFGPAGRVLVSADRFSAAGWKADGGGEVFRAAEGGWEEPVVRSGPGEPLLVVGDRTAYRVTEDPPGLRPLPSLTGLTGPVAAGPNTVFLAAAHFNELAIADPATGRVTGRFADSHGGLAEGDAISDLAVRPDGCVMATAAEHDRRVKLWDVAGGRAEAERVSGGGSLRLAFGRGGTALAVCEKSSTAVFDMRPSPVATVVALQSEPIADAAVSSDGTVAVAAGTPDSEIHAAVWEGTGAGRFANRDTSPSPAGGGDWLIALSADGRSLAYWSGNAIWLQPDRRRPVRPGEQQPHRLVPGPRAMAFGPEGRVWVAGPSGLLGWSASGPDVRGELGLEAPPGSVLLSVAPGSTGVWAGRSDGAVCRYGLAGGPPEAVKALFAAPVTAVAATADGSVVVAGSEAGGVRARRGAGLETVADLANAHRDAVTSVAVGPGGWFVTGSLDRTVKVWDRDGRLVVSLSVSRPVRRVFLSPDGRTLSVSAAGERGVRRWDLAALRTELRALGIDPELPE